MSQRNSTWFLAAALVVSLTVIPVNRLGQVLLCIVCGSKASSHSWGNLFIRTLK
jgi:hypothetical protein